MSPWSRKELQVVLQPDRVTLHRVLRKPSLFGRRSEVTSPQELGCAAGDRSTPWQGALVALSDALPDHAGDGAVATVYLSNHFVRYTLVPWSAELSGEEEMTFVRHCFSRIYGEAAQSWQLRLSRAAARAPRLASAVDAELLDGLRAAFAAVGIRLRSIQPYLMTALNGIKRGGRGKSAWFAMVEPGNLSLALLQDGRLVRLRSVRVGANWQDELELLLERERLLAESDTVPVDVHVWRQEGEAVLPERVRWNLLTRSGPFAAASSAAVGMAG